MANTKLTGTDSLKHELRTPLNGLLGMLQLLDDGRLDPGQADLLREAVRSGKRLARAMDDVFAYLYADASDDVFRSDPGTPLRALEEVVVRYRAIAERKGLAFHVRVHDDEVADCHCDTALLADALGRLVDNAVKFTSTGEIRIVVRCRRLPSGDGEVELEFAVKDTGLGIPAHLMEHVFEPFVQADSSLSRRFRGSGLGLGIARERARQMDGHITLRSAPGRGTVAVLRVHALTGRGNMPLRGAPVRVAASERHRLPNGSCAWGTDESTPPRTPATTE